MKTRLLTIWDRAIGSFWFLPTATIVSAVALGISLPIIDEIDEIQAGRFRWLATTPDGARNVLSVIAGAMITVAGVVFSVMMVTLSIASSQFGSRVLRNRMKDRAAQLALGAFLGTSAYCLLVLRTIHAVDGTTFVPHISVTASIVLAAGSLFVLIYFIHDVMEAVQAPHIVARLARDLDDSISRLFPEKIGPVHDSADTGYRRECVPAVENDWWTVESTQEGYLQTIDGEALLQLAESNDLVIHLEVRPGDFIIVGDPIASVPPAAKSGEDFAKRVNETLIVGNMRTPRQDVNSAILELAQLTVRALSPGINDPFTAMNGIDRLSAALGRLAQREIPSRFRTDRQDKLRVIADPVTFDEALAAAFNQIRQHAQNTPPVGVRLLEALESIACKTYRESDRQAIKQQANMILEVFKLADVLEEEFLGIQRHFDRVGSAIEASRSDHSAPKGSRKSDAPETKTANDDEGQPTREPPAEGEVNG